MLGVPLLATACSSAVGDILIIGTFLALRNARAIITIRMITWFACADLLGECVVAMAAAYPSLVADSARWCTLQAAINWFSVWSSWAWTMAFAHAVRVYFASAMATHQIASRRGSLDEMEFVHERRWHLFSWLVPLGAATAIACAGLFGLRGDLSVCSFRDERLSLIANLPLWLALGYNLFAYVSVHLLVHKVVHTSSGLLEPERQESLARRVRVWPRFTVYIATFVASQLPTAPFLVLAVYRDAYDEPFPRGLRTFGTVANVLSQAHGLLNALVFVATNRSVYRQCRGHELLVSSSSWSDAWARGPSALLCCCALGRDTPPVLDRASSAFSTEPARSHDPLGLLMDQDAWADAE